MAQAFGRNSLKAVSWADIPTFNCPTAPLPSLPQSRRPPYSRASGSGFPDWMFDVGRWMLDVGGVSAPPESARHGTCD